jgi:uncharacterized protein YjiS (DUF1127 family)
MNTTVGTPTAEGDRTWSLGSAIITNLKRRWMAYVRRRIERAVIIQLQAMSDRELQDIGITRAEIEWGVRGGRDRRPFTLRC